MGPHRVGLVTSMSTGGGDTDTDERTRTVALVELVVADPPEAWTAAGFTVEDERVAIGETTVWLTGRGDGSGPAGIVRWTLAGIDFDGGELDGLATTVGRPADKPAPTDTAEHPNGCIGLDHVVVSTPDLERTIEAFEAVGMECRRIRETSSYGAPMRQAFFRMGSTILEVVSGDTGSGQPAEEAPSTWFGLAVDVDDLDVTGALLGDGIGSIRTAVQPGRRIATFRHAALGLSVPVAVMDRRAEGQTGARAEGRADHERRHVSEDHGGDQTGR